jgi:hypothetical protein
MRRVGLNDKSPICDLGQRFRVDRHAAKRCLEVIDGRDGNAADVDAMGRARLGALVGLIAYWCKDPKGRTVGGSSTSSALVAGRPP